MMKKLVLFAVVLGAVSFTSCKKDVTCTCTGTQSDLSQTWTDLDKDEQKAAEDACAALSLIAAFSDESCSVD